MEFLGLFSMNKQDRIKRLEDIDDANRSTLVKNIPRKARFREVNYERF